MEKVLFFFSYKTPTTNHSVGGWSEARERLGVVFGEVGGGTIQGGFLRRPLRPIPQAGPLVFVLQTVEHRFLLVYKQSVITGSKQQPSLQVKSPLHAPVGSNLKSGSQAIQIM